MYRNLTGDRSVHLAAFPDADASAQDPKLEQQMAGDAADIGSG